MSFVFVSHASRDKKRIRHIVDALIAAGHKVWLDNPTHPDLGYTPQQVARDFYRIASGANWHEVIHDGLREADAVLVCWSSHLAGSHVSMEEIGVGYNARKLVSCRIDDVDYRTLPSGYAVQQAPDLSPDGPAAPGSTERRPRDAGELKRSLDMLVRDIATLIRKSREAAPLRSKGPLDPELPYLVDRNSQETMIGKAMEQIAGGGWRAFLIMGPDNECPDRFLRRLGRFTCNTCVGEPWQEIKVTWPIDCAPADFGADFGRALAHKLRLPRRAEQSATPADPRASLNHEIARGLAEKGGPVAVISTITAQEWRLAEPKRIRQWLAWWQALAAEAQGFTAFPILSVVMSAVEPGDWRDGCPHGRWPNAEVTNAQIWREAQRLSQGTQGGGLALLPFLRRGQSPLLDAPPVLGPIRQGDAIRWLDERFESADRTVLQRARTAIEALFGRGDARSHGVPLAEFVRLLAPVCEGYGRRR